MSLELISHGGCLNAGNKTNSGVEKYSQGNVP